MAGDRPRGGRAGEEEAEERRPALGLVIDIEGHRQQQHQPLDDLGHVGADAHQLQAIVQHRHDQAADHRADDGAHPAGNRRAADEDRRDSVELPVDPVEGAGGGGATDEHEPRQGGQHRHVHHHQEIDAPGVDARESGGLDVAAHGIDVAAENGPFGDEAVEEHQADQDQARHREGGPRPAAGKEVGQVGDHGAEQQQAGDHGPRGRQLAAEAPGQPPGPQGAQHQPEDGGQAQQQGQVAVAGAKGGADLGQVAATEKLDLRGHGDGVRLADVLVGATKEHHARQGDDEAGDADIGDPEALPGADEGADGQAEGDRRPGGEPPVAQGQGHQDARKGGHGPHRQIDVAGDDYQHHADGQHQDVGVAIKQIHDVGRGQHQAFGLNLKEGDQDDQREEHAKLARIAAKQVFEEFHGWTPVPLVVMSRIRRSGLAAARSRTPVMAPSRRV
jgi:hypothetical protein